MSRHWGEMPAPNPEPVTIPMVMEKDVTTKTKPTDVEGPALHQPSSNHFPPVNEPYSNVAAFQMDPRVLHTIKLLQYCHKVRVLISNVQHQQMESLKSGDTEMQKYQPPPPIPEYSGPQLKHQMQKPIPFMPRDLDNKFVRGVGNVSPPEIDNRTNRKLLRRSVAAICAHAGYDTCSESVLETLTDLTGEYMEQICTLLRHAVDNEALKGTSSFQDPMEQVYHEMGIGSVTVMHDFYQNRVVKYTQRVRSNCCKLQEEYRQISSPEGQLAAKEEKSLRLKEEPLIDIQFPSTDEPDDGDTDLVQLEGLGLDISMSQESTPSLKTEEDWHAKEKGGALESYDTEGPHSVVDVVHTPSISSEAGDSIQDPASVSASDIMSPPSMGMRTPTSKPPNKKRKR